MRNSILSNLGCPTTGRTVLLIVAISFISGCSGHRVRVDSNWKDKTQAKQGYPKVLVVAVTPDINLRCDFESFFLTQLRVGSVTAVSSCNVMRLQEPLSVEAIKRVVEEQQVDAVITTSLVAQKLVSKEGGSADTRGGAYYKATDTGYAYSYYGGFGAYGVPVVYGEFQTAPTVTMIKGEVDIDTRLFDASNAELVYEMRTTASNLSSRDSALAALTAPIADRLRKDGLVK